MERAGTPGLDRQLGRALGLITEPTSDRPVWAGISKRDRPIFRTFFFTARKSYMF